MQRSADWYVRVFGLTRLPFVAHHHGDGSGGYAVLLSDPRTGFLFGLHHHHHHHHHHDARDGDKFDERRVGLDHISWGVGEREDLVAWAAWLDELGVEHSGVVDKTDPIGYSVVVFRDPDNIQLDVIHYSE